MGTRLAAAASVGRSLSHATTRQIGVLVVDDVDDIRMVVRQVLRRRTAFEIVAEATDGLEAIELAASLQPDIVLLDLAMPRMSGSVALPMILAASPHSMVAVFSSSLTHEQATELRSVGAFACHEKTSLGALADLLEDDYRRFCAA